jgi:anthranilate phosphoribosyltransferase
VAAGRAAGLAEGVALAAATIDAGAGAALLARLREEKAAADRAPASAPEVSA